MAIAYHTHTFSIPTADAADLLAGKETGKVITPDVLGPVTAAGKDLLDDANAAAQRTTLGLGSAAVANLLDEDDMASDSATAVPSQQSLVSYTAPRFDAAADLEAVTPASRVGTVLVAGQAYERIDSSYWDLGPELVTNGDMSSSTGWTVNTGWAIGSGVATHTPGNTGSLNQNIGATGATYLVGFDVASVAAGSVMPVVGPAGLGTSRSTVGTFTEIITQAGGDNRIRLTPSSDFGGTVDNFTAKRLPSTAIQDAGGTWWGPCRNDFTAMVPGALARPVTHKLRERLTPLDLMHANGLAEAIRYRTATDANAAAITSFMQEAFDYCANNAIPLYIPAGLYYLDDKIASGPITVFGDGMPNTRLIWTSGATDTGILVESFGASNVQDENNRTTTFEKLALLTQKLHEGTALTIDMSNSIFGGTLIDRTTPRVNIAELMIQGATGLSTDAWDGGIDLISCQGSSIRGVRYLGYQVVFGDPNDSTFGIRLSGAGLPAQVFMHRNMISAAIVGYDIAEYEGVYMLNCDAVAVDTGVKVNNAVSEPLFDYVSGHIAANVKCMELTKVAQWNVQNALLYPNAPQTGAFIGIEVNSGCTDGAILGTKFSRANTTSLYTGIKENGGADTLIDNNTFIVGSSSGCVGIELTSNAVRTRVGRHNVYSNANVKMTNASTTARIEGPRHSFRSAVAVVHTGNTTETDLMSVTVPGGSLGANGWMRFRATISRANGGSPGNVTPRFYYGGSAFSFAALASANGFETVELTIQNRNSESSQIVSWTTSGVDSYGATTGSPATLTVVSSSDKTFKITGQCADAGDTITLESYELEVNYLP